MSPRFAFLEPDSLSLNPDHQISAFLGARSRRPGRGNESRVIPNAPWMDLKILSKATENKSQIASVSSPQTIPRHVQTLRNHLKTVKVARRYQGDWSCPQAPEVGPLLKRPPSCQDQPPGPSGRGGRNRPFSREKTESQGGPGGGRGGDPDMRGVRSAGARPVDNSKPLDIAGPLDAPK